MQSIKEHNLKANHNSYLRRIWLGKSVCNLSKNTIWKQITTRNSLYCWNQFLYAIYQRTQFESKSQLMNISGGEPDVCMQSIKEHNLKANHNLSNVYNIKRSSVCNLSKNTIWKQITTVGTDELPYFFCMQSIKEHNLKANHNSTFHV